MQPSEIGIVITVVRLGLRIKEVQICKPSAFSGKLINLSIFLIFINCNYFIWNEHSKVLNIGKYHIEGVNPKYNIIINRLS